MVIEPNMAASSSWAGDPADAGGDEADRDVNPLLQSGGYPGQYITNRREPGFKHVLVEQMRDIPSWVSRTHVHARA
jgi:hypothetical protein